MAGAGAVVVRGGAEQKQMLLLVVLRVLSVHKRGQSGHMWIHAEPHAQLWPLLAGDFVRTSISLRVLLICLRAKPGVIPVHVCM